MDYQDPLNMSETVIVVRSLVPGGIAQLDGRIVPGDRILHVNQVRLEHVSLDTAVQALKGKPYFQLIEVVDFDLTSGPAELGAQGALLHTYFLTNWQLTQAFNRKKNLKIRQKLTEVVAKM